MSEYNSIIYLNIGEYYKWSHKMSIILLEIIKQNYTAYFFISFIAKLFEKKIKVFKI